MPAWMQSQISLGAYVFPAATRLLTRDQPSTIDEEKTPFLDGTNAPAGTRGSKITTLEGTIGGSGAVDSTGTVMTSSNHAEAEINLLSSYLEAGYQALALADITPARTLMVQKRKSTFTPVPGSARQAYDFTIELLANDPRWLATAVTTVTGAPINGTSVIGGSAIAYPVLSFVGAASLLQLRIVPAIGGGTYDATKSILLQLGLSMGAGDTLIVDCNPRNRANGVLLNYVPRLDLINFVAGQNSVGDAAFFPYLMPGTNFIYANAGTPTVTVSWREAYLF